MKGNCRCRFCCRLVGFIIAINALTLGFLELCDHPTEVAKQQRLNLIESPASFIICDKAQRWIQF